MKIQKRFIVSAVFILMALSISLSVYAQEAPRQPQENTFYFVSSEMSFDGKVVKGAPYSAQAISETTQTLADGNRITRKSTTLVYRDSEGRTRREQSLNNVGPFATAGDEYNTSPVAALHAVSRRNTVFVKRRFS